ncbi:hypothetical protein NBRC106471_2793 [Acetobacter pasteurianus subsp. pasteurianus LMG 1262 = NBRC 106471]|nr:hypothetical protein NBRC106471_2793 [Acetobacter pasteurianus subsp. pasteurianus LMG 1262 = NBRC 106471]
MADAMKSPWQDMQHEAADELIRGECHDLLLVGRVPPVVLVAERHAVFVERQEAAVRDGDTVGIARQVGQHCFRTGKRRFGVDDPAPAAHRSQIPQKGTTLCQSGKMAPEDQPVGIEKCAQPGQEQAAEQLAQHANGQQESRSR